MYEFRLYVMDKTPSSIKAISGLEWLLEGEFKGLYSLELVDALANPELANEENIFRYTDSGETASLVGQSNHRRVEEIKGGRGMKYDADGVDLVE